MSTSDQPPPIPPASSIVPAAQPPHREKRRLKRVGPLSVGLMLALLYGAFGLIFLPFFILMMTLGPKPPEAAGVFAMGAVFMVFAPVMYAGMGFLTGVIGAALYNLFARWTGGIEVEAE